MEQLDGRPRIYLAGKITNKSWRKVIESGGKEFCLDSYERNNLESVYFADKDQYYNYEYETEDYIITGPHSLSCDHGCFHRGIHAATSYDECGDLVELEPDADIYVDDVIRACCSQIDRSDIVFAYIDSLDAYGTFAEIGYAFGKGKKIYIIVEDEYMLDQLWFLVIMACQSGGWCAYNQAKTTKDYILRKFNSMLKEIKE